MKRRLLLIVCLTLFIFRPVWAQNAKIEALLKELETAGQDTGRVKLAIDLSRQWQKMNNYDKALASTSEAVTLAKALGYRKGEADGLHVSGIVLQDKGEHGQALDHYTRSMMIREEIGDRKGVAISLNNIGVIHKDQGDYLKAIDILLRCMSILEEIGDRKGMASCLMNIGNNQRKLGNYAKAIDYHTRSMAIHEEFGNKASVATCLNNIGNIYRDKGDHAMAIDFLTRSLKIKEELNDRSGIANALNNIGIIYRAQGNLDRALENYTRSLELYEEMGDKEGMAASLANMGIIHSTQHNNTKALEYFTRSLGIAEGIGDKSRIASALNKIAIIHRDGGDVQKAIDFLSRSLQIYEGIGDRQGIAYALQDMGIIYHNKGDHPRALGLGSRALRLAQETGDVQITRQASKLLYDTYRVLNRPDSALIMHELYIQSRDSIVREENQKEVMRQQFQYDYEKKELAIQKEMELSALKHEYEKKQAAAKSEKEKQQLRYEEELKRTQIEADYRQKQAALVAEQLQKEAMAKAEQEKKDAINAEQLKRKNQQRNVFIGGFILMLTASGVFLKQRNRIAQERERSEELLLNILPTEVALELKAKGEAEARLMEEVTVLFTDFKGFTQLSEKITAKELVADLNECFSAFDRICEKHGVEKIKTIGDAYMAAGGLPAPNSTHAQDVVKAALEMVEVVDKGKRKKVEMGLPYFEIRIGIHTGPVVAGIVGVKKFQYDIWGDTVNTASRMESSGEPGRINISESTYQLLKDDHQFAFESRGMISAKGKGEMNMYFVEMKDRI